MAQFCAPVSWPAKRAQKGTQSQAIGRSRGEITTKILALPPLKVCKQPLPGDGRAR